MEGIDDLLNVQATMRTASIRQSPLDSVAIQLWRQLHMTLVSGAIVAGDRLHATGRTHSDECPFDGCRHTTEHLLWDCTAFDLIRRPFILNIGKLLGAATMHGPTLAEFIQHVYSSKTFRNTGIAPADPMAAEYAKKRCGTYVLRPPVEATMLITEGTAGDRVLRNGRWYVLVYTDGSVPFPGHPWLAHGGWGLFVNATSSANDYGSLEGGPFSSYRAELRGLVEAISRAAAPICVVLDNEAVCNGARDLIDRLDRSLDRMPPESSELPNSDSMWADVAWLIANAPRGFFRVMWVPSHLLEEGREERLEEYLSQGGELELLRGNSAADRLTNLGASLDAPSTSLKLRDAIACKLAREVQMMQVTIWAAFRGCIPSDQEVKATELAKLEGEEIFDPDFNKYGGLNDPFVQEFIAQNDSGDDCHVEYDGDDGIDLDGNEWETCAPTMQGSNVAEPSAPSSGPPLLDGEEDVSVSTQVTQLKRDILLRAPHFPYRDAHADTTSWRCQLKLGSTLTDILLQATLGRVVLEMPGGCKTSVRCQLSWIEPLLWALQQFRWKEPTQQNQPHASKRSRTCSWLELACAVSVITRRAVGPHNCSVITRRAVGPHNCSFLVLAAVVKKCWQAMARYLVFKNGHGDEYAANSVCVILKSAGASVTCGIANQPGLSRRFICDDHPGLSMAIAVLLKLAAAQKDRLMAKIPAYSAFKSSWQPSGLCSTIEQVRQLASTNGVEQKTL